MLQLIEIVCVNKANNNYGDPHTSIQTLTDREGNVWKRDDLHDAIIKGVVVAHVTAGNIAVNIAAKKTPGGTKYVQTESDNRPTNNLLNLPSC